MCNRCFTYSYLSPTRLINFVNQQRRMPRKRIVKYKTLLACPWSRSSKWPVSWLMITALSVWRTSNHRPWWAGCLVIAVTISTKSASCTGWSSRASARYARLKSTTSEPWRWSFKLFRSKMTLKIRYSLSADAPSKFDLLTLKVLNFSFRR
jgi:hypothetical protein